MKADKGRTSLKPGYLAAIVLLLAVFILPYLCVVYYTVPRNDEFASAYGVLVYGDYSLSSIGKFVANMYMVWEGNYSGHFLYTLLNPLLIGNIDSTVKAVNVISFLLIGAAALYVSYHLLYLTNLNRENRALGALIVYILLINCRFMKETLGWFTGVTYYTVEFFLGLVALIMVIKYCLINPENKKKATVILILACLMEAVAVGGTLQVSAVHCCLTLYLILWCIYNKRSFKAPAILFAVTFAFTLVDVLAPGYSVRKAADYESISLVTTGVYTLECVIRELIRICTETYIPYALLAIFLILMVIVRESKKRVELNPLIVAVAGFACICGAAFPVIYGYGEPRLADRGYEIEDMLIVFFSVWFILALVNALKLRKIEIEKSQLFTIILCMLVVFSTTTIANVSPGNVPSLHCWHSFLNGSVKDYSDYWKSVVHEIEDSDEANVVIDVPADYVDDDFLIDRVMLQEDETNWVNTCIAYIYGHETVRINIVETTE